VKSTEGVHFVGLDHVRALAVMLVFGHHIVMAARLYGATMADANALFTNSLLNQGHTGVALFMTLSGYLFTRLSDGRSINMPAFLANRGLRLAPLLGLVLLVNLVPTIASQPDVLGSAVFDILAGFVFPIWPYGGWSIAVELHFYMLFPLLLGFMKRDLRLLLAVVLAAMAFRACAWTIAPDRMQDMAYWTIIGRIDQFVLGMVMARIGSFMAGRHLLAAAVALTFMMVINRFDLSGGFANETGLSQFWIFWPTLEGLTYCLLIAWYDHSFRFPDTGVSRAIAKIGQWSYSIYLLHFFFVWRFVRWIDGSLFQIDSFVQALAVALVGFMIMLIPAALSYRFIESPFLRRRIPYLGHRTEPEGAARLAVS
jgi:peptidoglycan/LPS O-acetylase OafA/YrhL